MANSEVDKSNIKTNIFKKSDFYGKVQWHHLVDWLKEDGEITTNEAKKIIQRCAQAQSSQGAIVRLAAVGVINSKTSKEMSEEELTEYLARRANLEYIKIDPLKVDAGKVSDIISAQYAERHKILPLQVTAAEVIVAICEPFLDDWIDEVERQSHKKVRRMVANPQDIKKFTAEFFSLAKSIKFATQNNSGQSAAGFEQLVELGKTGKQIDANDQGVIQVVDWLWQYAFDQRASDIHLEPRREQGTIRFRIDGVLHPVYQVPAGVMNAITARVKLLGRMDVVERRRPQDGRIKTKNPNGDEIEMRLSTLPTAFGEKLVMRIFDPDTAGKDISALGFSSHDAKRWNEIITRPHGIILVTGPTGSGKTTTLYSTLKKVATEEVNVSTIEDPIERIDPALNQTQVQPQLDFSFAAGVRALMRQDPDIIMIGEIRDLETAEMAVQAALTGHLVFSTLHTNDAPSAITRLMELGIPAYLLSATLLGVLAQRLIRTLCPECKKPEEEDQSALLANAARPWKIQKGHYKAYSPVGCTECRMTGYKGRMGIYELMTISQEFKEMLNGEANLVALKNQAIKDGMRPLRLAGITRAGEGISTLNEVMAQTPPMV